MVFACLQMYFANKADNQINKLQAKREKEIDDNKRWDIIYKAYNTKIGSNQPIFFIVYMSI